MWAMFIRVRDPETGELRPWTFIGFQEHDERVTEIEERVEDENGTGSFKAFMLGEAA